MADTQSIIPHASGIYRIRNLVNGKVYIGSAVDLWERWRLHRVHLNGGTHHSPHLQSSWRKHGEASFVFEVIELVLAAPFLLDIEQTYIDRSKSYNRRFGYNASPTAGSRLGVKASPESLKRMSESRLGFKVAENTRKRISETMKGMKQTVEHIANKARAKRGSKHTEETKRKMALAKIGKKQTPEHIANAARTRIGRKMSAESIAKRNASRRLNNDGKY